MTTESKARIYRRAPKPLADGACPHCGRVVGINRTGRRREHLTGEGVHCTGSRVMVGEALVYDVETPPVVLPPERGRRSVSSEPDPRLCVCGWRPRRKQDGEFAAHRVRPDDPAAPYCWNGAEKSRP